MNNQLNPVQVEINKRVSSANDEIAEGIRAVLQRRKVFCLNLMGAPGSGKTSAIESLTLHLPAAEVAVIQGDLESDIDKRRLEASGIAAFQINTHSGCHLNARMIEQALKSFPLTAKKYLIIENVGNLVCPAGKFIGQDLNIVVSATTEGSDKPKKYPIIFLEADAVILSKCDLAEIVEFDEKQYIGDLRMINPSLEIIKCSAKQPASWLPLAELLKKGYAQKFAGG